MPCSYYGNTRAETVLGRALKDLPREQASGHCHCGTVSHSASPKPRLQFVLSTKVGRYGADGFDFSAERVTRSVEVRCRLCVPPSTTLLTLPLARHPHRKACGA